MLLKQAFIKIIHSQFDSPKRPFIATNHFVSNVFNDDGTIISGKAPYVGIIINIKNSTQF